MATERRLAVLGAGAVGCYLGGKLPEETVLIGRPPVAAAIERHGLIVRERDRESVSHPEAAASTSGLAPCDLVILAVRAHDVAAAIPELQTLIGESGLVLAMQNGVGSEELLAEALGRQRVLAGTLTVSVNMPEPGVIRRLSSRGGLALATMDGSPLAHWVVDLCVSTGLPTVTLQDYRALRWSKLLLNMLGAATSAILDVDLAAIVANAALFRLEQLALREAGRVMDAQRIRTVPLPGYPVPWVRRAMRLPRPLAQAVIGPRLAGARSGASPSMRYEVKRGRSEIGFLNGAVTEAGNRVGVSAPVNAALTELVEEVARTPERRAFYQGRPDRLLAFLRERRFTL